MNSSRKEIEEALLEAADFAKKYRQQVLPRCPRSGPSAENTELKEDMGFFSPAKQETPPRDFRYFGEKDIDDALLYDLTVKPS